MAPPLATVAGTMHSKRKKRAVLSELDPAADSEVYGTFGHAVETEASAKSRPLRQPSFKKQSPGFKVLMGLGVVLMAATFMVTRMQSAPRVVKEGASASGLLRSTESMGAVSRTQAEEGTSEDEPASSVSEVEKTFLDGVSRDKLKEFLHAYASVPHPAGTKQDYKTAVFTAKQLESFGISARIKEYYTLLSVPIRQRVAIVEPAGAARELNLTEGPVEGDQCTKDATAVPPFLAYAASGNATQSIVYVNYGTPEDFKWLEQQGIALAGKIALARYGKNFRGLKVMLAEQHHMAGVLIYSDPSDDGFGRGETYPKGSWRPGGSFQRGSSQFLSLYAGDPLTPGYASTAHAPRLSTEELTVIPHIPATVLSYDQAIHILESLGGTKAPDNWQGGLVLANGYHVGDDEATVVSLDLQIDNKVGPIWDVIGTIRGAVEPDHQVIIGNHRDAWVCGAVDPSSGSAVMLELARNLGQLLKTGWRPRRTIVLGSWDGEEYGLLGSTEFAEDNAEQLKAGAVAYLNVDNVHGALVGAAGTPSIAEFLHQTAKAVPANAFDGKPIEEKTLYDQWVAQSARRIKANGGNTGRTLGPDHLINLLGSGTDFTAFYQHLGIISANLQFSQNDGPYGVYHSTMDSLNYVENFADPLYATQDTAAKWWGLLTLRLADSIVLPFDFTTYGLVMHEDLNDFESQATTAGLDVDFSNLRSAISLFSAHSELFHARVAEFLNSGGEKDGEASQAWNHMLVTLERQLLCDEGLPHRKWFKHVIFGPGFFEGYAGTAFPGIADGLAFNDPAAAIQTHVDDVARIIEAAADYLV